MFTRKGHTDAEIEKSKSKLKIIAELIKRLITPEEEKNSSSSKGN